MTSDARALDEALRGQITQLAGDRELVEAGEHLLAGRLGAAEPLCRAVLKRDPTNVNAMCMLADIGVRVGALGDADKLLRRCLELRPDFARARALLAHANLKRQRYQEALDELDALDRLEGPRAALGDQALLRANIYAQTGRHDQAIALYQTLTQKRPGNARLHMSLGHALKTVGRQSEAVDAYRRAAQAEPTLGDAYWSLANLKTYRFDDAQIDAMKEQAASDALGREDFFHLCFALGKALEDRGAYDDAFWYYQRANVVRRGFLRYDADALHAETEAQKRTFTRAFAASIAPAHAVEGQPTPIFIVGLPRAGSTLLEQILASHSQVEGTQELPDVMAIARRLSGRQAPQDPSEYPDVLTRMDGAQREALGEEYLARTAPHRSGAPYFIDKMPNNFLHVGLIFAMLPQAIVIDARRNPMDCCFSGYKQLFARGQNFTYSLTEIGRYYRDYVHLMRHWDEVFPGRVIRVLNEDVIARPEDEIARLLDACGLDFEPACLAFHETDRAVKTASSEQVREPINAKGVGRWRRFEAHLNPLKDALGDVLESYRT